MLQRCGHDVGDDSFKLFLRPHPNETATYGWIIWRNCRQELPSPQCHRFASMKICVPLKNGQTPSELRVLLLDWDFLGKDWGKEWTAGPVCFPSMVVKKYFSQGRERVAVYAVNMAIPNYFRFRFEMNGQLLEKAYLYGVMFRPKT